MTAGNKSKSPVESFGDMVKEFGEAISKIFDDPELKNKAREFAKSAEDSAKEFGKRFKDESVREKFKDFKEAAYDFGDSVSDYFKSDREKEGGKDKDGDGDDDEEDVGDIGRKEYEWEKNLNEKMKKFGEKTEKAGKETGKKMEEAGDKADYYFSKTRSGRITGYSFAIVWSVIFLVFLNFYNSYIAYYYNEGGQWRRYSLLTDDFSRWLPIVSVALAASVVGNILLIIYDGKFYRQIIHITLNLFGIAAVISLLVIYPFDFTLIPGGLTGILNPIIIAALVLIAVGMGIGTIVRLVRLIVNTANTYQ